MSDKVNTSFNRGRDGDLVNESYVVIDNITGNTFFPSPNPTVAELLKATQEYQQSLYDASGRDQKLVAVKDNKRSVLRTMLTQMAEYVNSVSNGNREILLSSGFKLAKNRGEVDDLKPIGELEVRTDVPEQATIRVKRVPGAKAYIHEYTTGVVTNESVWVTKTITENWYTFKDLQSGVKYSFRVIAIGQGEKTVISPIVSRFIQ
jgi:fibronectin type 3 domain-containing protein